MANMGSINRIFKMQKLLLSKNSNFTKYSCRTNISKVYGEQTQYLESGTPSGEVISKITTVTYPTSRKFFATNASNTSIDEFRAREVKKEKEFTTHQEQGEPKNDGSKETKQNDIRIKILEAALAHVPTLGWSRNAIAHGAEDAGYPSVVHGMFPQGGYELVSYFYGKCNNELMQKLQKETQNGERKIYDPLDFLVRSLRMRLEMIAPYIEQWPQAMALIAMPQNATTSLAQVLTLVDDICYYSGDRTVDFGWYTRRIGLATIYKMTELYMVQDTSPNYNNTWEFLRNRMDEAVQLQMMLSHTDGVASNFQRSFNSAFITARNILGLDYNRR